MKLRLSGELSHEECATVLAALRFWQEHRATGGEIPEHFDHFEDGTEPLDVRQIDELCKRIALQDKPSGVIPFCHAATCLEDGTEHCPECPDDGRGWCRGHLDSSGLCPFHAAKVVEEDERATCGSEPF